MANFLNRTTKELRRSAGNAAQFPESEWIRNPDLGGVEGVLPAYWKISGDVVSAMTPAEAAAADAAAAEALAAAQKQAAIATVDALGEPSTRVLVGQAEMLRREFQALKAAVQQIADEAGVILEPPLLPSPSLDELRTILKAMVENG